MGYIGTALAFASAQGLMPEQVEVWTLDDTKKACGIGDKVPVDFFYEAVRKMTAAKMRAAVAQDAKERLQTIIDETVAKDPTLADAAVAFKKPGLKGGLTRG